MPRQPHNGSKHRSFGAAPKELLKSPAHTRARRQSFAELRALQRMTFDAIRRPLSPGREMQLTWVDGRPAAAVVGEFIKPNNRLTSFERIEIYNKQYWFRLLDCLYDDYPGLRAILGEDLFLKLRIAYLDRYPSRSFTLRDLGRNLVAFLGERPHLAGTRHGISVQMARFEWAQVVAFDGPAKPALTPDDLLGRDPGKLQVALQPYLTLLQLEYPLDDFLIAVKKQGLRAEASNAVEEEKTSRSRQKKLPKRKRIHVCVHRHDNELYYKRLEPVAFGILRALGDGATIVEAIDANIPDDADADRITDRIRGWFQVWTELGWLCKRA